MKSQEKEKAVEQVLFARRASRLSTNAAAGPSATAISFDSGHAFPGILPDLTQVAIGRTVEVPSGDSSICSAARSPGTSVLDRRIHALGRRR